MTLYSSLELEMGLRTNRPPPVVTASITPELWDEIEKLIGYASVRSVSCYLNDPKLWRMLVDEQLRRAAKSGIAAQHAFCLCGPDSGLADIPIETWGGDVHIPYEGVAEGDLLFLPPCRSFRHERLTESSQLGIAVAKRCNYVLMERDFGELPGTTRKSFGQWTLYSSKNPLTDCNPFRAEGR